MSHTFSFEERMLPCIFSLNKGKGKRLLVERFVLKCVNRTCQKISLSNVFQSLYFNMCCLIKDFLVSHLSAPPALCLQSLCRSCEAVRWSPLVMIAHTWRQCVPVNPQSTSCSGFLSPLTFTFLSMHTHTLQTLLLTYT